MSVLGWPSTTNIRSAGTYLESNEGAESTPGPSGTIYCGIEGYTSGTVVFSLEWTGDGADPTVWSDPGDGHLEVALPTDSFKYYNGLLIIRATVDGTPTDNQLELVITDDNSDPMFYSDWAWTSEPYEAPVEPVFWTDFALAAEYTGMTLRKDTNFVYIPGVQGVPASPAVPARPARWVKSTVIECKWVMTAAIFGENMNGWNRFMIVGGEMRIAGGGSSSTYETLGKHAGVASWDHRCEPVQYSYYLPAQPAVPAVQAVTARPGIVGVGYNLGWNSGARSISTLQGSGYGRFNVPANTVGAVVGFNAGIDANVDFRRISHAFYFARGLAYVYEKGVLKTALGAYTASEDFEIRRVGATVSYYKDGALEYTSTLLEPRPVALDASLYSGNDAVLSPQLKLLNDDDAGEADDDGTGTAVTRLPLLRGVGGEDAAAYARGEGSLPALFGFSGVGNRGDGLLPALRSLAIGRLGTEGPREYARSLGELPLLVSAGAAGGLAPAYALSAGLLSAISGASSGYTGGVGSAEGSLPAWIGLGVEGLYARSRGQLPMWLSYGSAPEGLSNAFLTSFALTESIMPTETQLFVVFTSEGSISSVFAAQYQVNASMVSEADASDTMLTAFELQALLYSYASATSIDTQSQADGEVWVVNLESNASTRYDNFTFNSFAKIGDTYYGAREGGIYALDTVDADAGAPIQALVNLGRQDFGSSMLKRMESTYMAVSSYGTMYLRVTDHDGQAYTYAARRNTSKLEQQRVDVGRGIEANFLTFELLNGSGGEDFELSGLEFMAVNLTRRIR